MRTVIPLSMVFPKKEQKKKKFISKINPLLESPAEEFFFVSAKKKGLDLTLQHQVNFGEYRIDFTHFGKKWNYAIEIDGKNFHTSKADRQKDYEKERYLVLNRFVVIRFTGQETFENPDLCVTKVQEIVRTWENL